MIFRMTPGTLLVLLLSSALTMADNAPENTNPDTSTEVSETTRVTCISESISISGETTAMRQVQAWADAYKAKCPQAKFEWDDGGHSMASSRVCDNHPLYGGVDMAAIPNTFFAPQASTTDGWNFNCRGSERDAIYLHVGHSGIRIDAAAGGSAASCMEIMGGLTTDQLRWIYSDLSMSELKGFKWDQNSVPFSDGDDSTHLWSELNENCTAEEILPVGPTDTASIGYTFLLNHVLTGGSEAPRAYYGYQDMPEMDDYLQSHPNAIAFWPFYDLLDPDYADRVTKIYPVGIKGSSKGSYVMPTQEAFETHAYPLLKRVDLGVHNSPDSMAKLLPFLEFALSEDGDQSIKDAGFWPIRIWEKRAMLSRIGSTRVAATAEEISHWCGPSGGSIALDGSPYVKSIAHLWSLLYNLACDTAITIEATNGTHSANRVCHNDADVALLESELTNDIAVPLEDQEFLHKCKTEKSDISVVQVEVAYDGVVLMAGKDTAAGRCMDTLGGLTFDQLRWIYSNFSEAELSSSGWDSTSLKTNNGNPETRKWSELDPRCEPEDIELAGGAVGSPLFNTLSSFSPSNEPTALDRNSGYFEGHPLEVLVHLLKTPGALALIPFPYYYQNQELFTVAALEGQAGGFVLPTEESIADRSYPLVRKLTMNLLNNKVSLEHSIPLLKFGYSHPEYLDNTGYIPLKGKALDVMLERLEGAPYAINTEDLNQEDDEMDMFNSVGFIFGFTAACLVFVLVCVGVVWFVFFRRNV